jgi:hypothetical protein
MAWAALLLASGDVSAADRLAGPPRYRARVRQWLREHPLGDHADRLRERAARELFEAHPSELARLRDRSDVLLTGASAADVVGLVGDIATVEFYAPLSERESIVGEHALMADGHDVTVRWYRTKSGESSTLPVMWRLEPLRWSTCWRAEDARARREAGRALAR